MKSEMWTLCLLLFSCSIVGTAGCALSWISTLSCLRKIKNMCCSDTALQGLCPAHSLRLAMDSSIAAALEPGDLSVPTDPLLANRLTINKQTASLPSALPFPLLIATFLHAHISCRAYSTPHSASSLFLAPLFFLPHSFLSFPFVF